MLRWPYHDNDRAQAERETRGHIKVVTDPKGLILGATIVGAAAGELITTWTLAINHGLNIRAFAELVVPYPTYTEIGKRAAVAFFTPHLTISWVRRILDRAASLWGDGLAGPTMGCRSRQQPRPTLIRAGKRRRRARRGLVCPASS